MTYAELGGGIVGFIYGISFQITGVLIRLHENNEYDIINIIAARRSSGGKVGYNPIRPHAADELGRWRAVGRDADHLQRGWVVG